MDQQALPARTLLVIYLLALVPRLAAVLPFLGDPIGMDDMHQYDMLARSLAAGKGYRWYARDDVARLRPYLERTYGIELPTEEVPADGYITVHRPPGYPLFLAAVYILAGTDQRLPAARLAQAFLNAALAPLTALLALRLGLTSSAARVAGALTALYPILWMYPAGLASENTFILLLLLGALALLESVWRKEMRWAALAGLVLGAATLTRGILAPFLLGAAGWLFHRRGPKRALAFLSVAALVVIPWCIRNSLVLGRPAYLENSLGYNLFIGYHPRGDGGFQVDVAVLPLRFLEDGARERWALQEALGFIRQDPLRVPLLLLRRLAYFWGFEDRELIYFYGNNFFGPVPQPWLALAYLVLVAPFAAVALSAPVGLALFPRQRGLTLLLVGTTLAAYLPILAEPRFHLPLIPHLAVYAAAAWTTPGVIRRWWQSLREGRTAWRVAAAACCVLIVLWAWDMGSEWPRLAAIMSSGGNQLRLDY